MDYPTSNACPLWVLSTAVLTSVAGCLPIPRSESLAPPVLGVYRGSTGSPLPGARLALSTEVNDSSCSKPAQTTTTDSAGSFTLPRTTLRHSFIILLPIDPVAPNYYFCATVADTLRPVFHGYTHKPTRPDTLQCLRDLDVPGGRVECSGWLEWLPEKDRLVRH
jgi:hypothetical protein